MTTAGAREKGVQWTVDYICDLWDANRLKVEELPCGEQFDNRSIANCHHVKRIFGNGQTRVPEIDPDIYEKVCKRSSDAVSKHPVLVVGNWRQGKSTLVNSLVGSEVASTGRRQKTTTRVQLHRMWAGEVGEVLLADTPGLEPDTEHDIINLYRTALENKGCSPDVLTDLIVLVVAGTSQGISSLTSERVVDWIRITYAKARGSAGGVCTILPVITHGDQIHEEDQDADKHVVRDRLQAMASIPQKTDGCEGCAHVMDPVMVCNPDPNRGRRSWGVHELHEIIVGQVKSKSSSPEFKFQWSRMLTSDLKAYVRLFHEHSPNDETEVRLFHRTVEATLATYGKRSPNIETAFPKPSWHILDMVERKLRNEERWQDRSLGVALATLPCSPREVCPFFWAGGFGWTLRSMYVHRASIAVHAINLLQRIR